MRMRTRICLAGALILMVLSISPLSSVQAKDEPVEPNGDPVKIIDILQNASLFEGKMIVIEGVITTECPSGCWFIIDDNSGSIYVDILPSNFVIPQKTGEDAKVYGLVTIKDGDPMITGKMVDIGGEVYQ